MHIRVLQRTISSHLQSAGFLLIAAGLCVGQTAGSPTSTAKPSTAKNSSTQVLTKKKPALKHHTSTKSSSRSSKRYRKSANWRTRGQQKIDPQRSQEIQAALIREHYLDGQPSATWTDAAQNAMERYQAANGWQKKVIPDSRALIKLGLGPDHEHLLNPESAMTNQPLSSHNRPVSPASESNTVPPGGSTSQNQN